MNNTPPQGVFVKVLRRFSSNIDFFVTNKEDMMNIPTNETVRPNPRRVGFERLQEARRAMRLSPMARHRQKWNEALRIIHSFGQTTSEIVAKACRSSSTRFLASMKDAGLIKFEKVLGQTFVLLTKNGLDMLRSMSAPDDELAKLQGTRSVNLFAFGHSVTAQRILANKLKRGGEGCAWWSERQLRAIVDTTEPGAKVPDCAFKDAAAVMTYVEVERSRKPQPKLEVMLLNLGRLLEKQPTALGEIYIEPGISERYVSTLKSWLKSGTFRAWSEDTSGELFQQGIYPITPGLRDAFGRIQFIHQRITP